ncbi:nuclear transport factor 2 family protein [Alteromonas abrolhosensis]|uniref:nuclear transport factor 2 family protein n=1 Tax=Alteromonas abrolhosensis TaxID=1892904 RepID=UPI003BACAFC3
MKQLIIVLILMSAASFTYADDNRERVNQTLDALHHNASIADMDEYFNLYHDTAVFIGTDASEVWNKEAFKAYAKPHFDKGKGWTYHPKTRNVYFSPNQDVAWFDELLDNESLGETRGTGVLIKEEGRWKITQYHLTIPIPNALADSVAKQIKAAQ